MQKLFGKLMIVLMVAALIAGCAPASQATEAPAAAATQAPAAGATDAPVVSADKPVTLKIMVWNNPATVDALTAINTKFQEKYPNITVDMSVDKTEEYWTTTMPTRLAAGDVDIFMLQGFPNQVQSYMKGVEKASWQTMAEAGQFYDLTGQAWLKNYDMNQIKASGEFNGKIYTVATGTYAFTGMFYNKDLFAQYNVKVPTTWAELGEACATFKKNNIGCMTSGGKDVWPLQVAAWGVEQAMYPDSPALLADFWAGKAKFNDAKSLETWKRMQTLLTYMEDGVTGIDNTTAPGRFANGLVAMYPAGTWDASNIVAGNPDIKFGYIPTPGSDNPEDNKTLGGKFDASFSVAGNAPNVDAAMKWLEFFSQPDTYNAYVNAVGILPTQPGAKLTSAIGVEVQPFLGRFSNHISVLWNNPKGIGKYAASIFNATNFAPYGEFTDAQKLADQVQADWEAALASVK